MIVSKVVTKNMSLPDILNGLAGASGPAGAEGSAARLAMELLSDYAPVRRDTLGNVIAELGNPKSTIHVMLDAHIDEVGLIVTAVDSEGFLHVDRCGSPDRRTMPGAEVVVLGRKKLPGIICCMPPHLATERKSVPEFDKLRIDIGLSGERARELVPPGSRVLLRSKPVDLLGSRIAGKALDNRCGAATAIRCVELLDKCEKLDCRLSVVLSVREEVGCQGAVCAAFDLAPTHALVIDAGFANQPGAPVDKCGDLGKGPMICAAPVLDSGMTETLRELADKHSIPWQHDICGGRTGTNADTIATTRGGVRCALVSVPVRNMHTPAEICQLEDIENTAALLAHYICTL